MENEMLVLLLIKAELDDMTSMCGHHGLSNTSLRKEIHTFSHPLSRMILAPTHPPLLCRHRPLNHAIEITE